MYRVEYFCPTQAPDWQQDMQNPFYFFASAQRRANALLWQYHAARVVSSSGEILYQV